MPNKEKPRAPTTVKRRRTGSPDKRGRLECLVTARKGDENMAKELSAKIEDLLKQVQNEQKMKQLEAAREQAKTEARRGGGKRKCQNRHQRADDGRGSMRTSREKTRMMQAIVEGGEDTPALLSSAHARITWTGSSANSEPRGKKCWKRKRNIWNRWRNSSWRPSGSSRRSKPNDSRTPWKTALVHKCERGATQTSESRTRRKLAL